jgi:GNAT superfamily N-acetyltransferase
MQISIRTARPNDMSVVLNLIQELAVYEKAPNEVINTVENLIKDGFGDSKIFDCIVAENNLTIVGFALYFTGYSTWKGRTLYLEDILVTESFRGKGVGSSLFEAVVNEAKKRGVKRMDWQVLEWNEPAIQFYKKYKATLDSEWINGRFFEQDLHA